MPIYDYRCEACGHEFDDLRGFNDPDPEACPKCGEDAVRKLITGGNFQLKGSGWYVTDYGGKKPSGAEAKPDDSGEATSSPGETSGGDTSSSEASKDTSDSGTEVA